MHRSLSRGRTAVHWVTAVTEGKIGFSRRATADAGGPGRGYLEGEDLSQ